MYANAQFKNTGNDEGDVLNFFNNTLRNLVQKNSGNNTFSIVSEDCHDQNFPLNFNTKTKLRLTHQGHTISQIEKGFIRVVLTLSLKLQTPLNNLDFAAANNGTTAKLQHLLYFFVGFKDAVELIGEAYFWVDGKLVDSYHQQDMVKESFAYNSIRPRDAKTGVPHSHSLWESVQSMSPNVAGVYIPFEKFAAHAGDCEVKVELTIPFTDQLALQAWRLYPNRILGEMEEEVKFVTDGLVWCQVNPQRVAEYKKFWDFTPNKEYNFPDVPITNHFTQIGQSAVIVRKAIVDKFPNVALANGQYACPSSGVLVQNEACSHEKCVIAYLMNNTMIVNTSKCKLEEVRCNCSGFGLKEDINNSLFEMLNEPIIIPAQELTRHTFEVTPSTNGFTTCSKSVPLRNATNITMMFPMHAGDCTVFKNIMYKDIKLVVNKKTYPETDIDSTYSGRFIQYQLMANELDGTIEPTQEYIESISRPTLLVEDGNYYKSAKDGVTNRFLMCPFDNTSFGINFQLERGNAGYVFDGIDTGSHTVTVEFRGTPINSTTAVDPYRYPDMKVTADDGNYKSTVAVDDAAPKTPSPEMWVCSDTYWTWSIQEGVKYYQRGIPAGYD